MRILADPCCSSAAQKYILTIDGHLVCGVDYRHLVDATRYGRLLLLDTREDPLSLSKMIVLYYDTQIGIWCGQCPPTEPIELLFHKHRHSESELRMLAPFVYPYAGRDNRNDPNPNTVTSEESEDHLESYSGDDSNSGQPESSATAARQGAPQEPQTPHTLRIYSTAQTSHTVKASTGTPRPTRNQGWLYGANDTEPADSESHFAEIFFRNLSVELVLDSEIDRKSVV